MNKKIARARNRTCTQTPSGLKSIAWTTRTRRKLYQLFKPFSFSWICFDLCSLEQRSQSVSESVSIIRLATKLAALVPPRRFNACTTRSLLMLWADSTHTLCACFWHTWAWRQHLRYALDYNAAYQLDAESTIAICARFPVGQMEWQSDRWAIEFRLHWSLMIAPKYLFFFSILLQGGKIPVCKSADAIRGGRKRKRKGPDCQPGSGNRIRRIGLCIQRGRTEKWNRSCDDPNHGRVRIDD